MATTARIGRVGVAPCGHEGEYVVGTYVECSRGCDHWAAKEPHVICVCCGHPATRMAGLSGNSWWMCGNIRCGVYRVR